VATYEVLREPPVAGDEVATLLGSLDRQRATLAWKCGGLDAAAMRATVGASTMTIGGLLKHLAFVEELQFCVRVGRSELSAPFDAVDWDADPDWPWRTAADDTPEALTALWEDRVRRAREAITAALPDGLDQPVLQLWWREQPSLRRILADMVEEYARHVGHADLIRESIDGLVGEDPPL
jgi:hypothetical protein